MKFVNFDKAQIQQHLAYSISSLAIAAFCYILIFILGRLVFILAFAGESFAQLTGQQWSDFLSVALRFDIKAAFIVLALPATVALLGVNPRLRSFYRIFFKYYNLLGFAFCLIMTVINYYYYQTYDRPIDVFIFAPFKEDPQAVFNTIVSDYPLAQGLLIIILTICCYFFVFKRLLDKLQGRIKMPLSGLRQALVAFVSLLILVIGIRGSFTTFPIRQINAQVSSNVQVNAAVPNGPMAFYWAYQWDQRQSILPQVEVGQILQTYADLGIQSADPFEPLLQKVEINSYRSTHQPDIVVALMESLSTHMLNYDAVDQGRDLYGSLRKYLEQDFYFLNFVSEGNGTSDSMTRLFTGVPDLNLSSSVNAHKSFILNSLAAFKKQGYHTIFITGGQGSWRNLDSFLRLQGFDEVLEMSSVRALYPQATEGTWGIDDEFVFGTVLNELKKPHDKPLLIFALSITNHPPYRVPGDYEPKSFALNAQEKQRFSWEGSEEVFGTLAYANDMLGKLIDSIMLDEQLKDNTFIAFTGDHNRRGIGYSAYPAEELLGYMVPFYLHIPKVYQDHDSIAYDSKRFGSHKDIMTTIAHHALSGAQLYSLGCDLLSTRPCRFAEPYNSDLGIAAAGNFACPINDKRVLRIEAQNLVVAAQETDYDCSRVRNEVKLQQQLYYYQAQSK